MSHVTLLKSTPAGPLLCKYYGSNGVYELIKGFCHAWDEVESVDCVWFHAVIVEASGRAQKDDNQHTFHVEPVVRRPTVASEKSPDSFSAAHARLQEPCTCPLHAHC